MALAHHEWGALREAAIGISPAEDFVVCHESSQRWLPSAVTEFCRRHAGRRLVDVDAELAQRIERQVESLAELLAREGVTVHRPDRLQGEERTFMAPNGEGSQASVRDPLIVVADHLIDGSLRLRCRQRERFGLRPIVQRLVADRRARWSSVPFGSPAAVDGPFLEGGDVLLNGRHVYVGMSGCASDMAGIDWLQSLLGPDYRVVPVALRSNVQHLENALALVRPGLLVWCPPRLIDGLPTALRDWDKIEVSVAEAERLATSILVLDDGRTVVESGNERMISELRNHAIEVLTLPFEGPFALGSGLRSACQALQRDGVLA